MAAAAAAQQSSMSDFERNFSTTQLKEKGKLHIHALAYMSVPLDRCNAPELNNNNNNNNNNKMSHYLYMMFIVLLHL